MKLNLYAVMDEKVQTFGFRLFLQTHGAAIRAFADSVRNKETALNKHPEDFALYFCGSFDDESGLVESVYPVQLLARGSEFILPSDSNNQSIKEAIR